MQSKRNAGTISIKRSFWSGWIGNGKSATLLLFIISFLQSKPARSISRRIPMDKRCEESRLVEAINTAQKFIDELSANLSKELERQRIQAKQIQRLTEERDDLAEKASDAIEQMASESLAF